MGVPGESLVAREVLARVRVDEVSQEGVDSTRSTWLPIGVDLLGELDVRELVDTLELATDRIDARGAHLRMPDDLPATVLDTPSRDEGHEEVSMTRRIRQRPDDTTACSTSLASRGRGFLCVFHGD